MAKNLVVKQTLDSSGVEQGAKQCEKSLGQIRRQAELAAKGLKSLANDNGLNAVKEQFTSLGKQIDKFSVRMTSGLGIKQQSRLITAQLAEVANVYRNMSNEEKASTAGQYLKQYMQELTVLGGQAKDTVQDMQAQIQAMASDTPIMAGLAEGVGLIADSFTIASGAAKALGVSEDKLADLQKQLTSLMAISNAAMNIKNALVNQGALKTALLNIQIRANALYTSLQAAAAGKATIAAKAAAVAQELWNKALKANPLMLTIGLIGGAIAAIAALSGKSKEAEEEAKRHAEAERKRRDEIVNMGNAVADNVGKQIGLYKGLSYQWQQLKSTHEKNQWIKDNKKLFDELGISVNGITEAEEIFVKHTDDFVQAMILRGKAMALQDAIAKEYEGYLKKQAVLDAMFSRTPNHKAGETITNTSGLREGVHYTNEGYSYNKRGNGVNWADVKEVKVDKFVLTAAGAAALNNQETANQVARRNKTSDLLRSSSEQKMQNLANQLMGVETELHGINNRIGKYFSDGSGGKSTGRTTRTTTTKTEQAVKGSLEWYDQQIKQLEEKLESAVDSAVYQKIKNDMIKLKNEKFFLNVELNLGKEEADKLFKQLGEPAKNTQVGSYVQLPTSITTSNPLASLGDKHMEEQLRQAQERAEQLLKSTEGLRLGAESAASAFSALGNAIGGTAGKAIDVAGIMAGAIATMIEAYATAIAGAAKLGPWAWVAFGLTGLAQLASMIATVKQLGTYDSGGIVAGNGSFYAHNDGIILRAHQGEMMLNKQQQRTLFDRINNGFDTTNGKVEFFISGRNLKGVLNNYNDKLGRL